MTLVDYFLVLVCLTFLVVGMSVTMSWLMTQAERGLDMLHLWVKAKINAHYERKIAKINAKYPPAKKNKKRKRNGLRQH